MKQIGVGVVLILAGLLLGRCMLWPPEPPRPPLPLKPDTVYVDRPGPTEIEYRDRWRVERDTVNTVRTVTIYDTTRVACHNLKPQNYILGVDFGEEYGSNTSVLTERLSFVEDSISFQKQTVDLYTDGMPARISIDSIGPVVEWKDFPTRDNSISIWNKLKWAGIGIGAFLIADEASDRIRGNE